MQFDHIAISGGTLAQATAHAEATLGVKLQTGGEHAQFHTHNMLLGLDDGLYLEALSVMPDAPATGQPRMFGIDKFNGPARLTNWICRCKDIDTTLAALPEGFGTPVSVARGDFRWRMAVPETGFLPFDNCAPAFIEWQGDMHPAPLLTPSHCRLITLTVTHPDAMALHAMLAPHLNDDRIRFEIGPAALVASFNTPSGPRILR
ncbi:MAG: VOC family protein [Sulfitobacter sp.]